MSSIEQIQEPWKWLTFTIFIWKYQNVEKIHFRFFPTHIWKVRYFLNDSHQKATDFKEVEASRCKREFHHDGFGRKLFIQELCFLRLLIHTHRPFISTLSPALWGSQVWAGFTWMAIFKYRPPLHTELKSSPFQSNLIGDWIDSFGVIWYKSLIYIPFHSQMDSLYIVYGKVSCIDCINKNSGKKLPNLSCGRPQKGKVSVQFYKYIFDLSL